ncbi:MAG: hypothetical protein ACJ71T_03645 [Actinomycetales bacterium]
MRAFTVVVASAGCAALLAACSSSSSGGGTSGDQSSTSSSSSSSSSSTSSTVAGGTTNLNPCQLVTRAEASKLAGVSLGPGKESTISKSSKECVYGGQTLNVFTVEVAEAASPEAANAEWTKDQAQAQEALKKKVPAGLSVKLDATGLSRLGDKAEAVRASAKVQGVAIALSGIYVLKGSTFFAFQDLALGKSAPSQSDLKSQAEKVLGRI